MSRRRYAAVEAAVHAFAVAQEPVGMIVGVLPPPHEEPASPWIFPIGATRAGGHAPDERTVWQVGSITKTFTATLLALATRDGLSLDAPAQTEAPDGVLLPTFETWEEDTSPISFVDLATHTASLPFNPMNVLPGGYSVGEMYSYLEQYALAVEPGTSWNYSNLGFGLLGNLLIESVFFASSYGALVEELKALAHLPMPDTVIAPAPAELARRAWPYLTPDQRAAWLTPTWPALDPSGALYSTLTDMLTWAEFNLGRRDSPLNDLLPITQHVYFDEQPQPMGLGWEWTPYNDRASCWVKGGNTTGFTSCLAFSHDVRAAVVTLCNSAWVWPQPLALDVMAILAR